MTELKATMSGGKCKAVRRILKVVMLKQHRKSQKVSSVVSFCSKAEPPAHLISSKMLCCIHKGLLSVAE